MLVNLILTVASAICGLLIFVFFRRMPAKWLLDYNESSPDDDLIRKQQIPIWPYALITSASCIIVTWLQIIRSENVFNSISVFLTCLPLFLIMIADIRTRIIPDQFVLALLPCSVLLWLSDDPQLLKLLIRLLAGLAGGLLLALAGWAGSKLLHQDAMGMGDVKLLAAAGFAAGIPGIAIVLVLSFLIAALPAVYLLIKRKSDQAKPGSLAFGPFIAVSLILVLVFEDELLAAWQWWLESALMF